MREKRRFVKQCEVKFVCTSAKYIMISPHAADLGADHLVLTLTLYQINMVPLVL